MDDKYVMSFCAEGYKAEIFLNFKLKFIGILYKKLSENVTIIIFDGFLGS